MIFLPGSVAGSIQTFEIQGDFEVFQTSIYGVSSTVSSWLALSGFGTVPNSANWQVYKPNTGGFLPTSQTDFKYGYLSGGNPSLDASLEPLSARLLVSVLGGSYYSKNVVPLKPYESPLDIPNLQLWLDASDKNTLKENSVFSASLLTLQDSTLINNGTSSGVLSAVGTVTLSSISGWSDEAWYFNGTRTSYITSNDFSTWNFSPLATFTVECWVYFTSFSSSNEHVVVTNYQNSSTGWAIQTRRISGSQHVIGAWFSGNGIDITGTTVLSVNRWYHIAVSGSPGSYKLFLNGIQEGSTFTGSTSLGGIQLQIGAYADPALNLNLNGYISNLRIFNNCVVYDQNFNPDIKSSVPLLSSVTIEPMNIIHWLDKSPNALTATQLIVNNQITLLSAEINGLNVVNFDGANDYLTLSRPITTNINYSQFFVFNRRLDNIVSTSLGSVETQYNYTFAWFNNTFPALLNEMYSYTLPTNQYRGTAAISTSGTHIVSVVQSIPRNTVDFYLDNFKRTVIDSNILTTQSLTANQIGRIRNSPIFYHDGMMGEIIHTNNALPNQEIDLVNRKLFDKWKVPKIPPYNKISQIIFATSVSALSSTLGTWDVEPTGFNVQWQRSNDNTIYTNIPNASSVVYNPTTADYGFFVRTSISASNAVGISSPSFSNVLQLTTQNIIPVTLTRTTIFTVSANRGTWNSTIPLTYFYQYQINTGSGWENFGTLTTSATAYLSAYETTPVDVRVDEYAYNSTLGLPS